jgi:hypothetical protein
MLRPKLHYLFDSYYERWFFYQQFSLKTVSLDAVFHALSHDILFNESEFSFCWRILIFRSFYPMYIVALFLSQNLIIFQNFVHQWIARIFLHRFIYFSKIITKNFRKKILKSFCVLIILAWKNDEFFFKTFLYIDYVIFELLFSIL